MTTMMLEEIERRQREFAEKLKREKAEEAANPKKKSRAKPKGVMGPLPTAQPGVAAATPRPAPEENASKIVGVPVPLEQHTRMEALIAKTGKAAGGLKSKKDILLKALESYLNNFDKAEAGFAAAKTPVSLQEELTVFATSPTPAAVNTEHAAVAAAATLTEKLTKAGAKDFFVVPGAGELIVHHSPSALIGPDALPKTCDGYLVRATTIPVPVGVVLGIKR